MGIQGSDTLLGRDSRGQVELQLRLLQQSWPRGCMSLLGETTDEAQSHPTDLLSNLGTHIRTHSLTKSQYMSSLVHTHTHNTCPA